MLQIQLELVRIHNGILVLSPELADTPFLSTKYLCSICQCGLSQLTIIEPLSKKHANLVPQLHWCQLLYIHGDRWVVCLDGCHGEARASVNRDMRKIVSNDNEDCVIFVIGAMELLCL